MIIGHALAGRRAPALALAAAASLLRSHESLASIFIAGLAYQSGNALPRPLIANGAPLLSLVLTGGVLALLLNRAGEPGWFLGIAALSWSLQGIRRRFADTAGDALPSTAQKRAARVVGFVLATIVPAIFWIPAIWLISLTPLAWRSDAKVRLPTATIIRRIHPLEVIMVLHQSHYFSYCYALPLLFDQSALGGVSLTGTWFACGWISYLSAEAVWKRFSPASTFVVGHACLALLLVAMAIFGHFPWLLIALWILSGLGGGTVYCLTTLHRAAGRPRN